MKGYLGETDTDNYEGIPVNKISQSDWALIFIEKCGSIDGEHHKAWLIDQIDRILCGTPVLVRLAQWSDGTKEYRIRTGEPSEEYEQWIRKIGDDYDFGCPP